MHTCARRECVCECVHFDAPARFHVSLLFPLVSETRRGAEERGEGGKEEDDDEEEEEELQEGDHPRGNGGTDRRRDEDGTMGTRETDERKMAVGPSCFVRRETQEN